MRYRNVINYLFVSFYWYIVHQLFMYIFSVFFDKRYISFIACLHGYYGGKCAEKCGNCLNNETCNNVNGTCTDGCTGGFKEDLCKTSMILLETCFTDSLFSNWNERISKTRHVWCVIWTLYEKNINRELWDRLCHLMKIFLKTK